MRYLAPITMLVLALALVQPVAAQSFKPDYWLGSRAYNEKDYATALKHFRSLAKQGDADAQKKLGWMYRDGKGVVQDLVMSYVWFNIVAISGDRVHTDNRDKARARLNKSDLNKAQGLSKLCHEKPASCPKYSFQ